MAHTLYIVAGMHRTGTSLAARMLEVFNISLPGELVGPAADNEKGFFEDREIVSINDELFHLLGLRWDSLHGFGLQAGDFDAAVYDRVKAKAESLLAERHGQATNWGFKDPRVSRLCGFWFPLFNKLNIDYRIVIPFRDPEQVVGSLAKRNQFAHQKSRLLWLNYLLDLIHITADVPRVFFNYESALNDPRKLLSRLAHFFPATELKDNPRVASFCDEFVSAGLQHNAGHSSDSKLTYAEELFVLLGEEIQPTGNATALFADKSQSLYTKLLRRS